MNEIVKPKCSQCGAEMPGGSAGRVCPHCAAAFLKAAPTEIPDGSGGVPGGFTPPSLAEMAELFPQLEILEFIGRGGMGAVYKARQRDLDRIVALKILPPGAGDAEFAERFTREARALARLNHPNIVAIFEFGRSHGRFFFLMEFVDGVTLSNVLQGGRISSREALAIVPEICDALQYAHDQGIVHRDIKPENILMDRRGRVKVADFGLAKLMEGGGADSGDAAPALGARAAETQSGKVLGTPQYMAPEQVEHPADVDHRADIYALGVVFYQMLTGELPGQRLNPPSRKIHIDVRLDEVVMRAMEREPERRYQQASEVKTAVETIASEKKHVRDGSTGAWWPRKATIPMAVVAGVLGMALIWFCASFLRKSSRPPVEAESSVVLKPDSATVVRRGDISVNIDSLGTVESSNSVIFAIPEQDVQDVIRKLDAHQPLAVEAYDREGKRFGHGLVAGVDNQIDTSTGTLKCRATVLPEAGNLMVPGLFLNLRMRLDGKQRTTETHLEWLKIQPLAAWIADLQNQDEKVRRMAELALTEMGTNTLPEIVKILNDMSDTSTEGDTRRYNTGQALKWLGPGVKAAFPDFVASLMSGQQSKAYAGAVALSASAPTFPEAFSILTNHLTDSAIGTRDAATYGVGLCLGSESNGYATPALPLLVKNLKDPVDYIRSDSAVAVMMFTQRQCQRGLPEPEFLIPPLIELLRDKYSFAREYAAGALNCSCFVDKLKPWIPALQQLLSDPEAGVRQSAERILQQVKTRDTNGAVNVATNVAGSQGITGANVIPANIPAGTLSFSVVANGTAPLSYQWFLNTNAIAGATNLPARSVIESNAVEYPGKVQPK